MRLLAYLVVHEAQPPWSHSRDFLLQTRPDTILYSGSDRPTDRPTKPMFSGSLLILLVDASLQSTVDGLHCMVFPCMVYPYQTNCHMLKLIQGQGLLIFTRSLTTLERLTSTFFLKRVTSFTHSVTFSNIPNQRVTDIMIPSSQLGTALSAID